VYFADEPEHVAIVRDLLGLPIVGGPSNMPENNIGSRLELASAESQ